MADASLIGTSPTMARSFVAAVPTGTGSALASIAPGGYYLVSTVDAWLRLDRTGGSVAAVPGSSQPGTLNGVMFLPANTVVPLGVDSQAAFFSVIGAVASGSLVFSGPMTIPRVPG